MFQRDSMALWPLPLAAGLLPAIATLVAWWLSVRMGLIPACNPLVEGCVSISRAARHDLPNHLFRSLLLPAAALQGLTWLLVARWLRGLDASGRAALRMVALLGLATAVALALYGSFLGTEGEIYRALRRWGTIVYFGGTCLNMMLVGNAIDKLAAANRLPLSMVVRRALLVSFVALALLGLVNALAGLWLDAAAKDRAENIAEWWGGILFTAVFFTIAFIWWRLRLRASLFSATS